MKQPDQCRTLENICEHLAVVSADFTEDLLDKIALTGSVLDIPESVTDEIARRQTAIKAMILRLREACRKDCTAGCVLERDVSQAALSCTGLAFMLYGGLLKGQESRMPKPEDQ